MARRAAAVVLQDPQAHGGNQPTRQWCLDVAAVNEKMFALYGQPDFRRAALTARAIAELPDNELWAMHNPDAATVSDGSGT